MCGQYQTDESWENEGGSTEIAEDKFAKAPGLAKAAAPLLLFMVNYLRPLAEDPTPESNVVASAAANLAKLVFGTEAVEDAAESALFGGGDNTTFLNIIEDFASEALH